MAKDYASRASQLLGISDGFVAHCLDRAVWTFAKTVENEMEVAVTRLPKNAKPSAETRARQRVIDQYLGIVAVEQPERFRAPVARG